uniref:Uncharacterized protein n=1 Tax=Ditylenchus dipsaci TaxID=166011 RepID=A0A915EVG8_9BILA
MFDLPKIRFSSYLFMDSELPNCVSQRHLFCDKLVVLKNVKPCDVGRSSKLSCQLINEVAGRFHFNKSCVLRWQQTYSLLIIHGVTENKYSCIKDTEHVDGSLYTASFSLLVMHEVPSNQECSGIIAADLFAVGFNDEAAKDVAGGSVLYRRYLSASRTSLQSPSSKKCSS